jgi:hypothetical protein
MKQKKVIKIFSFVCAALLSTGSSFAGAGRDHGEGAHSHDAPKKKLIGGPNGGRLITIVDPQLEFLLTPERFVQITFLSDDGEVVPVGDQVVSAVGGNRSAPTKVQFVKKEGRLISTEALPEMKSMPIILQIKVTPDAKSVREAFYLNLGGCGSCDFQEYACICGH